MRTKLENSLVLLLDYHHIRSIKWFQTNSEVVSVSRERPTAAAHSDALSPQHSELLRSSQARSEGPSLDVNSPILGDASCT